MQKEEVVKQNSLKAWVLASRPKTLAAAAVPVMVATAMALVDAPSHGIVPWSCIFASMKGLNILAIILCFLFAFVMQIDANFVNDYYDGVRGNDDETRLGPLRACSQGWVTLSAMRKALIVTTLLACLIGLPLAVIGGWKMILVGIACVLFCFLYTTCLSYWGLGDLLVLVFFGIVPTTCSYYVETGMMPTWQVWVMSVGVGLVIDLLLIINNYRDIENDRRAGKRTLAVFFGKRFMEMLYFILMPIGVIALIVCIPGNAPVCSAVILLWIHYDTYKKMKKIGQGRELNVILGKTARNIFLYGILSSISIIL